MRTNILLTKPEEKRPHAIPVCTFKDNIKMDMREIRSEYVNWIHLAQDRVQWWAPVGMVTNLLV
jgi:hypothetical protein